MVFEDKKKILLRLAVITFFAAILILGLCIYKDYGISTDESVQRQHSIINYRYVNEVVFGRNMSKMNNISGVLSNDAPLPALNDYKSKYYGVAIQMPLVLIEDISDFTMTSQQIYFVRHLYNFLVYFIALICFFFLCKDLIKSEIWAFAGTIMLFLFPRFFAEAFYNIKDLIFISLFIISIFSMFKMLLNKRKTLWCLFFAFTCALATNSRVVGGMLIAVAVAIMIAEDIVGHFSKNKEIKTLLSTTTKKRASLYIYHIIRPYIILCGAYFFFYIFITPASWQAPIEFVKTALKTFSDYQPWQGQMIFAGELISKEQMPWYYIPVWMGMTIPIFCLIMFIVGTCILVYNTVKGKMVKFVEMRYLWSVFLLYFIPLMIMIIFKFKIYLGWRHVYFLALPLLLISVYGAKYLHEGLLGHIKKTGKYIVPGIMCAVFVYLSAWMIFAHPYQNVYFNTIGRAYAEEFDRDYWRVASADMLRYLLNKYNGTINVCSSMDIAIMKNILTPEQQARIHIVDTYEEADFVLDNYRFTVGNDYKVDGFVEDYAINVDGYKIGSILKKEYIE